MFFSLISEVAAMASRSEFDWLIPEITQQPGTNETMVIGDGPYNVGGVAELSDMLTVIGDWIDYYKMIWAAFPFQPESLMDEKLRLFDEYEIDVFLGGNFLEAAERDGDGKRFLESVAATDCPGVEVSSTAIPMADERKVELIEYAEDLGLNVHGEIGKKTSETEGHDIDPKAVISEMQSCLEAGAEFVIYEMEEIEQALVSDPKTGSSDPSEAAIERFRRIVDSIGYENIMFEVPLADYYDALAVSWWFIDQFGADVNLGNVNPNHVLLVEQQRRGIGPYTF